jgi:hypothetical protein
MSHDNIAGCGTIITCSNEVRICKVPKNYSAFIDGIEDRPETLRLRGEVAM